MTRIVLDEELKSRLLGLKQRLEIIDEDGRVLGFVTPAVDRSLYEGIEPPFSKEELDRIEKSGGRRYTTAEVLEYLKKLEEGQS